ncbi:hypothetical protein BUALT_Bualt08G0102900 [Buddleja alternifolia]|uniref:Uncharacterized protein n=1 Tax=Buddleja alternifolia TaxID=168488 RepID=A0AAV6XG72_9LAMI|nr:hypothetical protein BUALT_Bualt08G0102900 [Buddleja alternifolia]
MCSGGPLVIGMVLEEPEGLAAVPVVRLAFRFAIVSFIADKKNTKESHKSGLTVNEEYLCAVRTKSYTNFFLKVQLLVNEPPSSSPLAYNSQPGLSQVLLDPGQEAITSLLESSRLFSNKSSSDLKELFSNYFAISAEASSFCSHILKSLSQVQADYTFVLQAINAVDDSTERFGFFVSELRLNNPFSKQDFKKIHEQHSSVLQHLKSKKKKVARKIKMIKCFNKASGVCVTAACGLLVAAAMVLAVHTLTALLMGPAIFSLPMKPLKKKIRNIRFFKYGLLRKIGEQLDVAAKGAYILNRDFDTMSRLVARLQDEIEHNKAMIKMCLERREDRVCLEVLKEIKKCEFGFRKQVEELEEHVYLCLVTINRARALVVNEISKNCVENSVQ